MTVKYFEDPDFYEGEDFHLIRGNYKNRDRGDFAMKNDCNELVIYKNISYNKKFLKYIG